MNKQKIFIKIFSFILTFAVLCASLPLLVFANQIEWDENTESGQANNQNTRAILSNQQKYDIFSVAGIESYFPLISHSAVAGHTGYLNLYSGELTYVMPLISTTDNLLPLTVSLVYNSVLKGSTHDNSSSLNQYDQSYTPIGMKLNICETIVELIDEERDRYYVYEDADGTAHVFAMNGQGKFTDIDGLELTFSYSGTQNATITDTNGTQKLFTSLGSGKYKLEQITDKYGNSVKFTFMGHDRPETVYLIPNGGTAIEMLKLFYVNEKLSMVYNPVTLDAVILRYGTGMKLEALEYVKCTEGANYSDLEQYRANKVLNNKILKIAEASFTYDSNNEIRAVCDELSGKTVSYVYQSENTLRISESAGVVGQMTDVTFKTGHTDVRTSGEDDELGNGDDIITRYVFDSKGRAKTVYSASIDGKEIYGATLAEYQTDDSVAKNKIKTATTLSGASINLLCSGGYEPYTLNSSAYWLDDWNEYGDVVRSNEASALSANETYTTNLCPEIGEPAGFRQSVVLSEGDYTLSFYVNAHAMEQIYGTLRIYAASSDDCIHEADIPRNVTLNTGGLYKFSTGFTVTAPLADYYVVEVRLEKLDEHIVYEGGVTIYDVILEPGDAASEYSLVTFGGFEESSYYYSVDDFWEGYYSLANVPDGFGNALVLSGGGEQAAYAKQRIIEDPPLGSNNSTHNNNYIVSGFVKVNGGITEAVNPKIRIDAYYRKASGSYEAVVKSFYFEFLQGVDGWQFFSEKFNAGKDNIDGVSYSELMYVDIVCEFSGPAGAVAYFDNISVLLDEGKTTDEYDYYSTTHHQLSKIVMHRCYDYYEYYLYDKNNRIMIFANSRGEMTEYKYDSSGILEFEITSDYIAVDDGSKHFPIVRLLDDTNQIDSLISKTPKSITEYVYDEYGLQTSVTVYSNITDGSAPESIVTAIGTSGYYTTAGTKKLSADYTYIYGADDNPSRIFGALETESRDEVYSTRYFYDQSDGKLLATVNAAMGNGTVNEYDEYDRLVNVYPATYSASDQTYTTVTNAESVTYSYDVIHRLSSIETDSTVYSFEYDSFDNRTSVSIGENEIVSYEYNAYNGKLKKIVYANGLIAEYEYNDVDFLSEIYYTVNGVKELAYSYEYNADGSIQSVTDKISGDATIYDYDANGKLLTAVQYSESDMEIDFSNAIEYYGQSGLIYSKDVYLNYRVGDAPHQVSSGLVYYYNPDETLNRNSINFPRTTGNIYYTYDEFDRISSISADYQNAQTGTFERDENYTYRTYGDNETDGLVSRYESSINGVKKTYIYTYDKRGYILTEYIAGKEYTYTYDDLGQLIQVYDGTNTYVYVYDNSGNITALKKKLPLLDGGGGGDMIERGIPPRYETLKTYGYTNSEWGDLLTSFNGSTITYDTLGNPLTYYDGTTFTWQGRQLVGAVKGTNTMSFTYNDNGLRTSKTVNGVTTEYYWNGNLLAAEKSPYYLIIYNYDASGRPIGMAYRESTYTQYQWDIYWFDLNLHGDVVAIYDNNGVQLISYKYDAWGKCTASYYNGGASTSATKNNLRYRSYYYDTDLGLYYLQSRYYDPNTYRFISPDTLMSGANGSLHGLNLYVYCFNNPINMTDSQGNWPKWVEDAWGWVTESTVNIAQWCTSTVNNIVKTVGEVNFTYSFGPSIGVMFGPIAANFSPTLSIDSNGNVAFQNTLSWGITSSAGFGACIGKTRMITNAPNVSNLNGEAGVIGASLFVPVDKLPIGGSVDLYFIPDSNNGKTYFGYSVFGGIAASPGGDVHGGMSYTSTAFQFNIINLFKEIRR
ncbi:MAG: hypothetical protein IKL79_03750 [Clostridia bacterium]|nr:hypothetical protein [Clostridia bacterium]